MPRSVSERSVIREILLVMSPIVIQGCYYTIQNFGGRNFGEFGELPVICQKLSCLKFSPLNH